MWKRSQLSLSSTLLSSGQRRKAFGHFLIILLLSLLTLAEAGTAGEGRRLRRSAATSNDVTSPNPTSAGTSTITDKVSNFFNQSVSSGYRGYETANLTTNATQYGTVNSRPHPPPRLPDLDLEVPIIDYSLVPPPLAPLPNGPPERGPQDYYESPNSNPGDLYQDHPDELAWEKNREDDFTAFEEGKLATGDEENDSAREGNIKPPLGYLDGELIADVQVTPRLTTPAPAESGLTFSDREPAYGEWQNYQPRVYQEQPRVYIEPSNSTREFQAIETQNRTNRGIIPRTRYKRIESNKAESNYNTVDSSQVSHSYSQSYIGGQAPIPVISNVTPAYVPDNQGVAPTVWPSYPASEKNGSYATYSSPTTEYPAATLPPPTVGNVTPAPAPQTHSGLKKRTAPGAFGLSAKPEIAPDSYAAVPAQPAASVQAPAKPEVQGSRQPSHPLPLDPYQDCGEVDGDPELYYDAENADVSISDKYHATKNANSANNNHNIWQSVNKNDGGSMYQKNSPNPPTLPIPLPKLAFQTPQLGPGKKIPEPQMTTLQKGENNKNDKSSTIDSRQKRNLKEIENTKNNNHISDKTVNTNPNLDKKIPEQEPTTPASPGAAASPADQGKVESKDTSRLENGGAAKTGQTAATQSVPPDPAAPGAPPSHPAEPPTRAEIEAYRSKLEQRLLERYNNLPDHAGQVAKVTVVLAKPLEVSLDGTLIRAEFDQLVYDPWGKRISALEQEYFAVTFGSGGPRQIRSEPSIRVGLDQEAVYSEHAPLPADPFKIAPKDAAFQSNPQIKMPNWWRPEFKD